MFRIQVIDTDKRFAVELYDGDQLITASGSYEEKYFVYKGELYMLTGGDYWGDRIREAALYKLTEVTSAARMQEEDAMRGTLDACAANVPPQDEDNS